MENILILPGDGIGPEVMGEVRRIIEWFGTHRGFQASLDEDLVGGCAYDACGAAISDAAMEKALAADAVLLGAVGGPKWDNVAYEARPEAGLLRLRADLELFANLRPAICFPALADASSLKREIIEGLDIMIVRELTGGVYFGEPRGIEDLGNGQRRGVNTQVYETYEIERIARVAGDLAMKRGKRLASSEKRNVMESGLLWNEEVTRIISTEFPELELEHVLADNCAMQLVRNPKQYDVLVTDNLFGDILSDIAAMLTGSLGMLPSASLGAPDAATGRAKALYEPVHGSAPDIAGQGLANPIASILSFAMALRYTFDRGADADLLEGAVTKVLDQGVRTGDIMQSGMTQTGTSGMGDAILAALESVEA
ncbi:3-isopropylmalate dehydrogenase [Alphaproteobacteria bacterium]|nr:3-isopropylmalate dehydrogenase [Alphaproteobacteria bacterium]MDC0148407.1 3-isopropylmalate dehydrogenase [Alphaproteobacteria bacterium]